MIDEILNSVNSLGKKPNEPDSFPQRFAKEILKNLEPKITSISSNLETTHLPEKPSYIPRHRLSTRSWDKHVEDAKLMEIRLNYLDKTEQLHYDMIESLKEDTTKTNGELTKTNADLIKLKSELVKTNADLVITKAELAKVNEELRKLNVELVKINEEEARQKLELEKVKTKSWPDLFYIILDNKIFVIVLLMLIFVDGVILLMLKSWILN